MVHHTEDQIRSKLRGAARMKASGASYGAIVKALGISSATYSRWRNEYPQHFTLGNGEDAPMTRALNGHPSTEAERLARLERENAQLKLYVADVLLRERGIIAAH
jgi:transposase-like protein